VRTGVRFYVRAKVLTLLCVVLHYDYCVSVLRNGTVWIVAGTLLHKLS
jgi:hypothetical protein